MKTKFAVPKFSLDNQLFGTSDFFLHFCSRCPLKLGRPATKRLINNLVFMSQTMNCRHIAYLP